MREMTKDTFQIGTDDSGKRYVYQFIDEMVKNHRESSNGNVTEGRMYEIVGDRNCPVLSFQFYLFMLHPGCTALWQKPRDSINLGDVVWFCNSPLGKNSLSSMMSKISKVGKLSVTYTNHSVRATSITVMDQSGIDSRHIMKVSGHASETSLKSYSHTINESKKRQISAVLSNSLQACSSTSGSSNTKAPRLSIPEATVTSAANLSISSNINLSVDVPSSTTLQETLSLTAISGLNAEADASALDMNSDILNIFDKPFELVEAIPQPVTQAHLLDTTNIHNMLNIPATSEQNNRGFISFNPKFDANCNVTINFNNYYN